MQADLYVKAGFRWLPLVPKNEGACALNIVILRRDEPFMVTNKFGDLDGRVKTLLDGLRMPQQDNEVPSGLKPSADEDPLFVLMEDDSSIFELNITADRLYTPVQQGEVHRDVVAMIHVKTKGFHGQHILNWP